jgi:hypothetical protein
MYAISFLLPKCKNGFIIKLNRASIQGGHTMYKPQIHLKVDFLQKIQREKDINETKLAAIIGVNPSQLYRAKKGECKVGVDFIAGALAGFPDLRFDDLFFIR